MKYNIPVSVFVSLISLMLILPSFSGVANAEEKPSLDLKVVPQSGSTAQGKGITATVIADLSGNWENQTVEFSVTGGISENAVNFDPESVPVRGKSSVSSTMFLRTSASTKIGTHEVAILARNENLGVIDSSVYKLTVESPPDFSINVTPPDLRLKPGASGSSIVRVEKSKSFSEVVSLGMEGVPKFVDLRLDPSSSQPPFESVLSIETSSQVKPGTYNFSIRAVSKNTKSRAITYTLIITEKDDEEGSGGLIDKILLAAIAISLIAAAKYVAES